jgi:hypothetical protein
MKWTRNTLDAFMKGDAMPTKATVIAATIATLAAGCAASHQQRGPQVAHASCAGLPADDTVSRLYGPGSITRVEPIQRTEFLARAIQRKYVIGANLYVPAEPGMTAPYLERVLSCHAVSRSGAHPNDPLRAQGVADVDVDAAGPSLRITIMGNNRTAGAEILQRARALQGQQGDVSVQQLSAAEEMRGRF